MREFIRSQLNLAIKSIDKSYTNEDLSSSQQVLAPAQFDLTASNTSLAHTGTLNRTSSQPQDLIQSMDVFDKVVGVREDLTNQTPTINVNPLQSHYSNFTN